MRFLIILSFVLFCCLNLTCKSTQLPFLEFNKETGIVKFPKYRSTLQLEKIVVVFTDSAIKGFELQLTEMTLGPSDSLNMYSKFKSNSINVSSLINSYMFVLTAIDKDKNASWNFFSPKINDSTTTIRIQGYTL